MAIQQPLSLESVFCAGFILFRRSQPLNEIEYLLIQSISDSGKWGLPKGHVEKGESNYQAAIRETEEEVGLKAKDFRVIPDFTCDAKWEVHSLRDGHKMKIVTLWLAEIVDQQCGIKNLPEGRRYKWAALKEAIHLITLKPHHKDLKKCFEMCEDKIRIM